MSDAIAYATIRELGARYRKRELSPVEVTKTLLARIEKLDPVLHAFVTPTPDRALADARAAEEALKRGDERPLLGIPIGHKDIYLTRGIRTTGGSALFADWVPDQESTVVRKWAEAGTIMMGKRAHFDRLFRHSTRSSAMRLCSRASELLTLCPLLSALWRERIELEDP